MSLLFLQKSSWIADFRAQITVETCLCRTGYGGKEISGPERGFFYHKDNLLITTAMLGFPYLQGVHQPSDFPFVSIYDPLRVATTNP